MSREISRERIEEGDLLEDEVRYLRDRNELPADYRVSEVEGEPEEEPEARSTDNYPSWTNDELREELELRDLATHGNKSELVARLREDDEEE